MKEYQNIWELALLYLKKGIKKNFVIHTEGVVMAMKLILKKEKGDPDILIPATILHDVGRGIVPKKYQCTKNKADKLQGKKLHVELVPKIIRKILQSVNYKTSQINEVIEIV